MFTKVYKSATHASSVDSFSRWHSLALVSNNSNLLEVVIILQCQPKCAMKIWNIRKVTFGEMLGKFLLSDACYNFQQYLTSNSCIHRRFSPLSLHWLYIWMCFFLHKEAPLKYSDILTTFETQSKFKIRNLVLTMYVLTTWINFWIKELTSIFLYISTKVLRSILVLEYASTLSAAYSNPQKIHT